MNNYKLIVFDWDGTLYDSAAHIVQCMQQTARDFKFDVPAEKQLRHVIGLSFEVAATQLFPEMKGDDITRFATRFRQLIYSGESIKPALFSGVKEVLEALTNAKYGLAIATGKARQGLDRELDEFGLNRYFLTTRCACETQSKPHPQMLLEIMEECGVTPNETLMIGDTVYDLELAANAKVDAVAVSYGVHAESDLMKCQPKVCLSDIRELTSWLG